MAEQKNPKTIAEFTEQFLKDNPSKNFDQQIVGQFKFTATTAKELDESIWPTRVRDTLTAIQDLVVLSKRGQIKPVELRCMKLYQVTMNNLRDLVEDIMLIRLGKDANFSFALERGFEELLRREVDAINTIGTMKTKVRFIKPKHIDSNEYPLYERIAFRFDGQFEVQVIDRFQYAGL